ncbi:MAG: hypothetical protein RIS47_1283 [Bacteroidota bacterium]|jgi:hypothetical protein
MHSREEAKQTRVDFWTYFGQYATKLRIQQQRPRKWTLYKTGLKGVELKFDTTNNQMVVTIDIYHKDSVKRLEMYERFGQVKSLLNEAIAVPVTWTDNYTDAVGKTSCRIYISQDGMDIYDRNTWPTAMQWFAKHMLLLEDAFEEVKPFLKAHWSEIFEA